MAMSSTNHLSHSKDVFESLSRGVGCRGIEDLVSVVGCLSLSVVFLELKNGKCLVGQRE